MKKFVFVKTIVSLCLMLCLSVTSVMSVSASEANAVGVVMPTDISAYINGYKIPSYNINGSLAVIVSDLNHYGLQTSYDNSKRLSIITLDTKNGKFSTPDSSIEAKNSEVYESDIKVQIAGNTVDGFNIGGKMAVRFSDLKVLGDYSYNNEKRISLLMLDGLEVKSDSRAFDESKVISSGRAIVEPKSEFAKRYFYDPYNVYYDFRENGTMYLYGSGNMLTSYSVGSSGDYAIVSVGGNTPEEQRPWASFGNKIKKLVVEEGVTSIGGKAFVDMESIETIVLPNSLLEIGNKAFFSCESIVSVNLPANLEEIGESAFQGCESLKSITIPQKCNELGRMAFWYCTNLSEVSILSKPEVIPSAIFCNCAITSIVIPESVKYIYDKAFCSGGAYEISSLKQVYFMGDMPEIGTNVFFGAQDLTLYHLKNKDGWAKLGSVWTDSDGTVCNIRTFEN